MLKPQQVTMSSPVVHIFWHTCKSYDAVSLFITPTLLASVACQQQQQQQQQHVSHSPVEQRVAAVGAAFSQHHTSGHQ